MHLSLLSTNFEPDRDAEVPHSVLNPPRLTAGRAHRDGVIRGLVFIVAAFLIGAVLTMSGLCHSADAGTHATFFGAQN